MPSPDLIAPGRLEELMGGAVPEGAHEARVQGLARELRWKGEVGHPGSLARESPLPVRRPSPAFVHEYVRVS